MDKLTDLKIKEDVNEWVFLFSVGLFCLAAGIIFGLGINIGVSFG